MENKNLSYKDYDCVEDILEEALSTMCGIDSYTVHELEKDKLYIVGTINIVKVGDKPNTLKHYNGELWSEDVEISESYEYATYYDLEVINKVIKENLTGKFYL